MSAKRWPESAVVNSSDSCCSEFSTTALSGRFSGKPCPDCCHVYARSSWLGTLECGTRVTANTMFHWPAVSLGPCECNTDSLCITWMHTLSTRDERSTTHMMPHSNALTTSVTAALIPCTCLTCHSVTLFVHTLVRPSAGSTAKYSSTRQGTVWRLKGEMRGLTCCVAGQGV